MIKRTSTCVQREKEREERIDEELTFQGDADKQECVCVCGRRKKGCNMFCALHVGETAWLNSRSTERLMHARKAVLVQFRGALGPLNLTYPANRSASSVFRIPL